MSLLPAASTTDPVLSVDTSRTSHPVRWRDLDAASLLIEPPICDGHSPESEGIEAIYVPTRRRPHYLDPLLKFLRATDMSPQVFLIPTTPSDVPQAGPGMQVLPFPLNEFQSVYRHLLTPRTIVGEAACQRWDLPMKRNYALWHAKQSSFKRILLMDDDVVPAANDIIRALGQQLEQFPVAGAVAFEYPDTSVVGHALLVNGAVHRPFLSGNNLGLDLTNDLPLFASIYNEDWLAIIDAVANRDAVSVGTVMQKVYDPFSDPRRASWQESGEIFVDALYKDLAEKGVALADAGRVGVGTHSYWNTQLEDRREWLRMLLARMAKDTRQWSCVQASLIAATQLSADDFVEFHESLNNDRIFWNDLIN